MAAGSRKHYVAKVQFCKDAAELNARQEEAALQYSIHHPSNLDHGEDALQCKINESISSLPYGEWVKFALRKMLTVAADQPC